ncbi:YciI family protein [Streptomyces synnematoformans]|uniref:YCII-related domain-containing protein n=1 Tax=Streptomyces synnematoformans TaxID=415721 RepID=A0ABN2XRG7_9ACTN
MKYVLLFVDTPEFQDELQALSPAERARLFERVDEWFAEHAGRLRGGQKLRAPESATTVRLGGGEPVVVDGPFVEGKEVVSGYAEVEVADLDEALRMVADWPGCPVVEIRPVEVPVPGSVPQGGAGLPAGAPPGAPVGTSGPVG